MTGNEVSCQNKRIPEKLHYIRIAFSGILTMKAPAGGMSVYMDFFFETKRSSNSSHETGLL